MHCVGGDDARAHSEAARVLYERAVTAATVQQPQVAAFVEKRAERLEQSLRVLLRRDAAAEEDDGAARWETHALAHHALRPARGREDFGVHAVDGNDRHGTTPPVSAYDLREVLAEYEIMRPDARVETRERAEGQQFAPTEGLARLRVLSAAEVVALGGAAHEHEGRESREPARGVGRERSRAVALNQHRVEFSAPTPKLHEDRAREAGARRRPHTRLER